MAKRSDFAQKLLDDLRLRKERLAASQSSNRTNTTVAADAYAYARTNYRGSRGMKTTETTGFRTGATQNRSSGGNKHFTTREAAKQIVPFRGGQSSEQMGDLSRALAFAFENGGKLRSMDSSGSTTMLAFLNQLGRGSMDYTKMERRNIVDRHHRPSTSHFPTLSHVHIEEISRGAQKLNQILRACSNGLNFDRYSIEIGKELLKGAIDLEESLRMLVNLQEASEYMVSPQRKSRITLLEEDEDEDEDDNIVNPAEQWQLDRPRFSFDKRSRNYRDIQEVARNDLKMRLAALTYPLEATNNYIYEKQSSSHKRSTSRGPNVKNFSVFSEQKNTSSSSKSKVEKARIPNVIAKLMGLEELPENEDSKRNTRKDSGSKQKVQEKNLKKTVQVSTKNSKKKTDDTENLAPPTAKQKTVHTNKIHAVQNNAALQAERNLVTRNASFQPVIQELENVKPATGFEKTSIKLERKQSSITQSIGNVVRLKDIQEKQREQKGTESSKFKEPVLKDELQRTAPHIHKKSEAGVMYPEKTGFKEGTIRTENNYPNKLFRVSQDKSQSNLVFQQPHRLRKSEPQDQAGEREQQNAKHKLPIRKQKGSESIFTALSKPRHDEINLQKQQSHRNQAAASKKSLSEDVEAMGSERIPVGRHNEDIASNRSSISASKNSNQDTSPRDLEFKLKPKSAIPSPLEKKPVHEPDTWKAESARLNKREIPRKINEVMIKRGGTLQNPAKALKHQHSILQEVKQRSAKISGPKEANHIRASKSRETEVSIIKSNISVASIKPSTGTEQLQKEAEQVSVLYGPEEEIQSLKEPQTQAPDDSAISVLVNDQQGAKPVFDGDEELKSHIIESNSLDGIHKGSTDISYTSQPEHRKISKSETPEPLSGSENNLKQILIKSQVFLHTAEALFKLNIPFGVLHAGGHDCQDEESKLILDCGYEVMKRRGRRQELSVHPFIKVGITATKVKSLDNLVRELHKDIEKLKFYGRNGNADVAVEDYLPKMLENDLYNKDPDLNCMWDLSWNDMMSAFLEKDDVIRDVERYVLNELVDEITRDLYHIHVRVQAF